jgi:hypothetical protein
VNGCMFEPYLAQCHSRMSLRWGHVIYQIAPTSNERNIIGFNFVLEFGHVPCTNLQARPWSLFDVLPGFYVLRLHWCNILYISTLNLLN